MNGWSTQVLFAGHQGNNVRLGWQGRRRQVTSVLENCDPLAESEHRFPPDLENADEIWIKGNG